jgi:hypothetical protein
MSWQLENATKIVDDILRSHPAIMLFWTEATKRPAGGANNPHGCKWKPGGEAINVNNVNVDLPERPQGNSAEAGLRRLHAAATPIIDRETGEVIRDGSAISAAYRRSLAAVPLPQPHARPFAVLVDEDHARGLKGGDDLGDGFRPPAQFAVLRFQALDGWLGNFGGHGKVGLRPREHRARRLHLTN